MFLAQVGQISFEQKESQPVVQFLWNRTAAAFMKIDLDNYQLRKKAFQLRIKQFTDYIWAHDMDCRSSYLAAYFGEKIQVNVKYATFVQEVKIIHFNNTL